MVDEVTLKDGVAEVVLSVPHKNTPICERLERSVKEAVQHLNEELKLAVRFSEMTQKRRAQFMNQVEGGPKPAQSQNQIDKVVAVLSGKGGVGKSSVTSLLAVALARMQQRVGILDADITGPSIPKMFGLREPPIMGDFGLLPVETDLGIKVISVNLLLPGEDEAVIWRGPRISGAIKQFWQEVFWGELDYLVVDLPPGTSDASLTVMQSIPLSGIVLVTSPQDLAGMVVRKAARMAVHLGAPLVGVVENMSYVLCPKCGEQFEPFGPSRTSEILQHIPVPFLGQLPLDPLLAETCDAGGVESYSLDTITPIVEAVTERMAKESRTPQGSR
jgi:Mrp family chromosome partitioning ATPase